MVKQSNPKTMNEKQIDKAATPVSPQKFLETYEGFDFDEAFTDNELEHITNAMSSYHKLASTPVKKDGGLPEVIWGEPLRKTVAPTFAKELEWKEDDIRELMKRINVWVEEDSHAFQKAAKDLGGIANEVSILHRGVGYFAAMKEVFLTPGKFGLATTQPNKSNEAIEGKQYGEWQLCPKCNGDGHLGRYNSLGYMSTTVTPQCDVCNGSKIIQKPSPNEQGERKDK